MSETNQKINWGETTLGDVVDVLDSQRIPINSEERSKRLGKVPYYGATGQVGWIDEAIFNEELVLLGEDAAPFLERGKSKAYLISGKSWVNNHAHVIRAKTQFTSNRFICHYLNQFNYTDFVNGTTRLKLTQANMRRMPVFLPPIDEQKRIVAKLDELLPKVDACKQRLEKIPTILKRFRQSVLAAAVSGKLTEEWRRLNCVEPSISNGTNKAKQGVTFGSDASSSSKSFELDIPDTWSWSNLQHLGELARGKSKHRPRDDDRLFGNEYPFIQTGDVARAKDYVGSHSKNYSAFGLAQSRLFPTGTLCITIAANIADTAILSYPCCFPDSIVGFVPKKDIFLSEMAMYWVQYVQTDLETFAPATAQKNINLEILEAVPVPVPSIAEQHEIVRIVKSFFARYELILERLQIASKMIERASDAILSQAFSGNLVPQDPSDEPASQLLERFKATLTHQSNVSKPKRVRKIKDQPASAAV